MPRARRVGTCVSRDELLPIGIVIPHSRNWPSVRLDRLTICLLNFPQLSLARRGHGLFSFRSVTTMEIASRCHCRSLRPRKAPPPLRRSHSAARVADREPPRLPSVSGPPPLAHSPSRSLSWGSSADLLSPSEARRHGPMSSSSGHERTIASFVPLSRRFVQSRIFLEPGIVRAATFVH